MHKTQKQSYLYIAYMTSRRMGNSTENAMGRNIYSSRIRIGPPLLLVKDIDIELRFYGEYFDLQPIRKYQDHRGGFIYDLGFRHLSIFIFKVTPYFLSNTVQMQKSLLLNLQDSFTLQYSFQIEAISCNLPCPQRVWNAVRWVCGPSSHRVVISTRS